MSRPHKIYVSVVAHYDIDGNITPLKIIWKNNIMYSIDKITQKIPAASLKSGGYGMRYTCTIHGHVRYLYLEESRWFIEKMEG
ncbi:MAG: hypothetical protein GX845_04100 [Erysipelothrix sp.]|jgi:hypothetical protein|nr:hypothetical protein [Erysipelothrix sp.]